MGFAHAAHISKVTDAEIFHIEFINIGQCRCNDHAVCCGRIILLGGKPHDFGNQGNKQPAHADLIVQGTCLHFLQDHLHIMCQRGVVGRGKNAAPAMQYLGQQAAVWQGCGVKEGAQQLLCIGKNIAPFAGTAGVGPGCMRNIPGNKGNIPGFERNNLPGKVHFPTVTFTNADFQAVMKMQHAGWHI